MVASDVVEDILTRSAARDLIRCKSVCKSWYSLISTPCFVKAHLKKVKHTCNDDEHKRIVMIDMPDVHVLSRWKIVGSSGGLVCVNPTTADGRIFVTNPLTRETRKLPIAPFLPSRIYIPYSLCLSFGYDSSIDDYKVVMTIWKNTNDTLVQVLSLKSNVWKLIGQFKYVFHHRRSGVVFNGALHWFVIDHNTKNKRPAILSFDLSREEFRVIPQPNSRYLWQSCFSLGVFEDCLCIFCSFDDHPNSHKKVWVLRNYNVKQSWELLPTDCNMKHDAAAHSMHIFKDTILRSDDDICFFCHDDKCIPRTREYIGAPLFVPTLISPYVNNRRPSHEKEDRPSHEKEDNKTTFKALVTKVCFAYYAVTMIYTMI
ncbi:putative F-box domain-containing protein [Tanacetum coccineum]